MDSPKTPPMQIQTSLPKKIILTVGIMFVLILLVYFFAVPNPNMILIAGLVLCSALFGFGGGIIASVIMLVYTLYFFSTDHSFTQFTAQNLQKVGVSLVGIAADMLLVCLLKRAELQAFHKVEELTKQLHHENEMLQHLSLTDALTGIRNRMALRQDYESYQGHKVLVMMLDLNHFKQINDTRGHEEGDRVLKETGKLLSDTFGPRHCYRYGGDEFLVIVPDCTDEAFHEKLETMMRSRPVIDGTTCADFAIGHILAEVSDSDALRSLISTADERMYEAKRGRRGTAVNTPALPRPDMKATEYTVREMRNFLSEMSGKYDLARVVDPAECRILELREDGTIRMNERCYGIWNAEQKCINCSSAIACRTGCHQEKAERFQDNVYFIQSNPVKLKLANGSVYDAVVELVNVEKESKQIANDRAAENIGNRAAHYLAHHDRLTNVLNADAFYELSREIIKNSPRFPWVMITGNIMNFRLVNTLFGVQRGNEVLIRTASLLRELSERSIGLCGRLGGDQFALLLPKSAYQESALLNISQELARSFNSGIFTFCMHFGVYEIEDPSIPVSVMCGRANSALRTIREDLTHVVAYFNDAILNKLLMEQTVIGSFEEALQSGQFQMFLQPLVGPEGHPVGAEALVRWCKPDGTILAPGAFIETLEHAGLIHKLDLYIWELAVKQLSLWKQTENRDLYISVNMSAKDFFSIDVYDALTKLVDQYGVDARMLRLEITETALLAEPEQCDAVLSKLRSRGFLVEIDDFGTGYSSLSLLKDIRADVLKIDMSFLREISDRERSKTILRTVIRLADSLGMEVITEGVETEQQLQALLEMGCSRFQGYYFSRPIPTHTFEAEFSAQKAKALPGE